MQDAQIQCALDQIAYVAGELQAVRDCGFTEEALKYPRSHLGLVALCAFNGIRIDQAPHGWKYWPNKGMQDCWERVIEALRLEFLALDLP